MCEDRARNRVNRLRTGIVAHQERCELIFLYQWKSKAVFAVLDRAADLEEKEVHVVEQVFADFDAGEQGLGRDGCSV